MSVRFKCSGCGKSIQVPMAHAGKRGKCPGCDQILQIPTTEQIAQMRAKRENAKSPGLSAPLPSEPVESDPFADFPSASTDSAWDDDNLGFPSATQEPAEAPVNPYSSPQVSSQAASQPAMRGNGYAGFWKRAAASILDGLILAGISKAFELAIEATSGVVIDDVAILALLLGYLVFELIFRWLYFALQECSAQQATIGKRALGIIVVNMNGKPISFGQATGRYFGKFLSTLIFFGGFFMAGFTEKKQALHDMLAGTLVVNK